MHALEAAAPAASAQASDTQSVQCSPVSPAVTHSALEDHCKPLLSFNPQCIIGVALHALEAAAAASARASDIHSVRCSPACLLSYILPLSITASDFFIQSVLCCRCCISCLGGSSSSQCWGFRHTFIAVQPSMPAVTHSALYITASDWFLSIRNVS